MPTTQEMIAEVQRIPAQMRYLRTLREIRAKLPEPYQFSDEDWSRYSWDWVPAIEALDKSIEESVKAQAQLLTQMREAFERAVRNGTMTPAQLQNLRNQGLAGLGEITLMTVAIAALIVSLVGAGVIIYATKMRESNARAAAAATIASAIANRIKVGQPVPAVPSFDEFMNGGGGSDPIDKAVNAAGTAFGGIAAVAGIAALIWFWRK